MSTLTSSLSRGVLPFRAVHLITPARHFVEDSLISSTLVLAPFFLPLGGLIKVLSIVGGIWLAIYNGLTDRPGSLWPLFGEWAHRIFDTLGVAGLLLVPWFFPPGIDRNYLLALGVAALFLNLFTDFTPDPRPARPFAPRLVRWLLTVASSMGIAAAGLYGFAR